MIAPAQLARLTVDLDAIRDNWRNLAARNPGGATGAAVKADAYGMGLVPVTAALYSEGCRHFFVATSEEGLNARKAAPDAEIFVLSGVLREDLDLQVDAGLRPVLNSLDEIDRWRAQEAMLGKILPCAVHVDTGMNRLGLSIAEAMSLTARSDRLPRGLTLLMSHLACADHPRHAMNDQQKKRFDALSTSFPGMRRSLANSAGILGQSDYGYDLSRPGIALHGAEAIDGTIAGLSPAATLEARILQVRSAAPGETVGYGAAHPISRKAKLAVCGLGYADGLHRAASGAGVPLRSLVKGGEGWIVTREGGRKVPLVGRISMDLCIFDVTGIPDVDLETSTWIEIFGRNIAVDDHARAAGTIGYEILCSVGSRVARRHRTTRD